jgi:putative pyoverdin transport system ATP-binding/permease protein
MVLFDFLRRYSPESLWRIAIIATLSGVLNTGILAIVNAAADSSSETSSRDWLLIQFLFTIASFTVAQYYLMSLASSMMESAIDRLRLELFEGLLAADLPVIEHTGRAAIYTAFSRDTRALSESAMMLCVAGQAAIMVLVSLIYLASISGQAFAITTVMLSVAAWIFLRTLRSYWASLDDAARGESEMMDLLDQSQRGFKEVKLYSPRAAAIVKSLRETSRSVASLKVNADKRFAFSWVLAQLMSYAVMGALVFLLPRFNAGYSNVIQKVTSTILFISAPTMLFAQVARLISTAETSAGAVLGLRTALEQGRDQAGGEAAEPPPFTKIRFDEVEYWYGKGGFGVGPLEFEIAAGETVFLVGGNGSGKTTLLKLLTGLYLPKSGRVLVDEVRVERAAYQDYRSMFSAIFSDYHVFDRLYGHSEIDELFVESMLTRFDLRHKTSFANGKWATRDLSTGQKKRLAMIVAHLEDRPVWVLDEWAADQDPEFRHRFYVELLPELKKSGKTIIAASHDDRYFHVADRVYKMEAGRFVALKVHNPASGGVASAEL